MSSTNQKTGAAVGNAVRGASLRVKQSPWIISVIGVIVFFVLWELVARTYFTYLTLPQPTEIYMVYNEHGGLIISNLVPTLVAAIVGFVGAVVLGFLSALAMSANRKLEKGFFPLMVAGNSIPRVALAPLIIFYIDAVQPKYVIAAWVALFPMFLNAFEGLEDLEEPYVDLLDALDATLYQEYRYVRFPNSLPFLFDGMKLAVTLSFVGAIVGEYVLAQEGMGFLALFSIRSLQIPLVFAVVMVIGFIATLAFLTLFVIQDRVVHWKSGSLFAGEQ